MQDHVGGYDGAIEDECSDVDEPLPGFEPLPADAECQIDRHGKTGSAGEEDKENENFFGGIMGCFWYFLTK